MPLILVAHCPAQILLSPELPFAVGKAYQYQALRPGNVCSLCTRHSRSPPEPLPPLPTLGAGPWAHNHPPVGIHNPWDDTKQLFSIFTHKTIPASGFKAFDTTPSGVWFGFFYIFGQMEASISHTFPTPPPRNKPSPSNSFPNHGNRNPLWFAYVTNAPRSAFCLNSCEKQRVCFTQRYITLD